MATVRRDGALGGPLRASLPVPPVLLTSGTTGTPKGAQRSNRVDPTAATAIIDRIPYRHDDVVAITSPLFHAWGLAQMLLASALGATTALTTSFDATRTLEQIERERVTVLAVVPAILQRLLASPALETDRSLVAAHRRVQRLGTAGSGRSGVARARRPESLQPLRIDRGRSGDAGDSRRPGGRARDRGPRHARIRRRHPRRRRQRGRRRVPIGRIFVGNGAQFEQYTGGGGKEIIDGLDVVGRRRLPDRRRAAVRDRAGRRHDRERRRERLPPRGGGPAARPPRHRRRRRRRCRRPRVRPASRASTS